MRTTGFQEAASELVKASARYTELRGYFERFCTNAKLLAEAAESPMKGLTADVIHGSLVLGFLDRKIRVSMTFRRKTEQGLLRLEDLSASGEPVKSAEANAPIPFDIFGRTDIDGGWTGGKISLDQDADCKLLALFILAAAVDRDQPQV